MNQTSRRATGQSPANLQRYLRGVNYPASKDDLIDAATENEAPKEIMELLDKMQDDDFGGPQDVQRAYGDLMEEGNFSQTGNRGNRDDDIEEERRQYEDRKKRRQQEQQDDDDAWDHRLKGHETKAIKDAREMRHGYDGRGRVTDEETDQRLKGNETEAIKDAREMKHGYDGRGRVRKFGPGNTDETIADDRERYEDKQQRQRGESEVDPETGSHSRRRKDDEGQVVRGGQESWQERYREQAGNGEQGASQRTQRRSQERPAQRQSSEGGKRRRSPKSLIMDFLDAEGQADSKTISDFLHENGHDESAIRYLRELAKDGEINRTRQGMYELAH